MNSNPQNSFNRMQNAESEVLYENTVINRLTALENTVNDTIPSILLKISEQQVSLAKKISELQRSINDSIIN
jgi:hypothetical protein